MLPFLPINFSSLYGMKEFNSWLKDEIAVIEGFLPLYGAIGATKTIHFYSSEIFSSFFCHHLGGFSASVEGLKWISKEWSPPKEKKAYDSVLLACRNQYKWEEVIHNERMLNSISGLVSKGPLHNKVSFRLQLQRNCQVCLCLP